MNLRLLLNLGLATSIAACVLAGLPRANAATDLPDPIEIIPNIGHNRWINDIAGTPDGRFVVTASFDGSTKLWDRATNRLIRTFQCFNWNKPFGLSADGQYLAEVCDVGQKHFLTVFALTSAKPIWAIPSQVVGGGTVLFLGDSKTVVVGHSDAVEVFDAAKGKLIRRVPRLIFGSFDAFAATGDGSILAVALNGGRNPDPDGHILLYSTKTWKQIGQIDTGRRSLRIAISDDGRFLATGNFRADGDDTDRSGLTVWNLPDRTEFRSLPTTGALELTFGRNATELVVAEARGGIVIWDAASGKTLREFPPIIRDVGALSFPRGSSEILAASTYLVQTASFDLASENWAGRLSLPLGDSMRSVQASIDGDRVAIGPASGRMRSWQRVGESWSQTIVQERATHRMSGTFALSTPGDRIADEVKEGATTPPRDRSMPEYPYFKQDPSEEKLIALRDAATGKVVARIREEDAAASFSPDGSTLLICGEKLVVVDAATGTVRRTIGTGIREDRFYCMGFTADGRRAFGSYHGKLALIELDTGEILKTTKEDVLVHGTKILVSKDGSEAYLLPELYLTNSQIVIWDMAKWAKKRTIKLGFVVSEIHDTSGDMILVTGADGAAVISGKTGALLASLPGAERWLTQVSLAFSRDGTVIYGTDSTPALRVWNARTGRPIATHYLFLDGEWLTITPEGFFSASAKGAERLSAVRGTEIYSIDQVYQQLYRPDLVREKLSGDPKGLVKEAAAKLDLTKVTASGQAPGAAITTPLDGATVGADVELVTVEATLTDQGGGIGKAEWRVNGVTLGVDGSRGVSRPDETPAQPLVSPPPAATPGQSITVKRSLALSPGENRIELVAYNAKDLVASVPVSVTVSWTGAAAGVKPKLYVLAVGINDYLDRALTLSFARPDAVALADGLKRAGIDLYATVEVRTLLDKEATIAGLEAAFAELAAKVRPEDVLVFYLAGHGKTEDGRFYFLPYDFRYENAASIAKDGVDQDRLQKWFSDVKARKSIMLVDSCESGSLARGLDQKTALDKLNRATGRMVLSAASDNQLALEGYRGHGVFTYAILDALGAADSNRDDLIQVGELITRVMQEVPEISRSAFGQEQIPIKNDTGIDFPLSGKMTVLADAGGGDVTYPTEPTHVVITAAKVRPTPDADAVVMQELTPGMMVTLVETDNGWVLVAKDGRRIGYVEQSALAAKH